MAMVQISVFLSNTRADPTTTNHPNIFVGVAEALKSLTGYKTQHSFTKTSMLQLNTMGPSTGQTVILVRYIYYSDAISCFFSHSPKASANILCMPEEGWT